MFYSYNGEIFFYWKLLLIVNIFNLALNKTKSLADHKFRTKTSIYFIMALLVLSTQHGPSIMHLAEADLQLQ